MIIWVHYDVEKAKNQWPRANQNEDICPFSSLSSGRVEGGEKHEIYTPGFGGHLLYDLFLQHEGMAKSATAITPKFISITFTFTNSPQNKNSSIVNFVLPVSLELDR